MNQAVKTPVIDTFYSNLLIARGRAQQDFIDGLSFDENPFDKQMPEHYYWAHEFDSLEREEALRDLSAP